MAMQTLKALGLMHHVASVTDSSDFGGYIHRSFNHINISGGANYF